MTEKDTLLEKILEGLCLKGELPNLASFLSSVNNMIDKAETSSRVVLMIDAVNEANSPDKLWKELQEIANFALSREGRLIYPWLKIIVAIRDTAESYITDKIKAEEKTEDDQKNVAFISRLELFFKGMPEDDNKKPLRTLQKFTGHELDLVLKRYLGDKAPSSQSELGKELSNPLFLRIYRDLPEHKRMNLTGRIDVLDVWLDWIEDQPKREDELTFASIKKRELIRLFSKLTIKNNSSKIHIDELISFTKKEQEQAQVNNYKFHIPVLDQLKLNGLIAQKGLYYEINDQLIQGLCLARYLEPDFNNKPINEVELTHYAMKLSNKNINFIDAFSFLIKRRLDNEQFEQIGKIWSTYINKIHISDEKIIDEKDKEVKNFEEIWKTTLRLTLVQLEHRSYMKLISAIEETNIGVSMLGKLCHQLAYIEHHTRFSIAIRLYEEALKISKDLYKKYPERLDLASNYTSSCNNLALILVKQGKEEQKRGIELYEEALKISKDLYKKYPERLDLAIYYARICNNLANILVEQGKEEQQKRGIELKEKGKRIREILDGDRSE
ncbi:MAG: hypothetical protein ACOCRO_11855, partial [Halanaerobiales bacterium]